MLRLYKDFSIVSAGQLWLALLLRTPSVECTVSRGHMVDGRDRVECLFLFFVCVLGQKYQLRIALHSSVVDSISPKSFLFQKS